MARNTFIPPPQSPHTTVVTTTVKGGGRGGEMADVLGKKFEKMGPKKKDRMDVLRDQMHEFEVSSFGGDGLML